MHRATSQILTCFLLGITLPAFAQSNVAIRFDELPFQSADGIHYAGVAFDFQVNGIDSSDAYFGSFGPGDLNYVSDPSLTGNSAGILTLTFDVPTPFLEFGAALSTSDSLHPGLTVHLFRSEGSLLDTLTVETVSNSALGFSEGKFSYVGGPISKAVIDFADAPQDFAFDNLAFLVPEPHTSIVLAWGIILVITIGRNVHP